MGKLENFMQTYEKGCVRYERLRSV